MGSGRLPLLAALAFLVPQANRTRAPEHPHDGPEAYVAFSRFTDPGERGGMLEELPDDVIGICERAREQTVHHNLLPWLGVPRESWEDMARPWPPRLADLLATLELRPPHDLVHERAVEDRLIGACMLESHLLAGMLRAKGIPVRIRAGYFRGIRANAEHVVRFWEATLRARGVAPELLAEDPERWRAEIDALTRRKNEVDHHIEHWACEYWDADVGRWRLLDANDAFLRAHSGLEVGFRLPEEHFERAHVAWRALRDDPDLEPERYAEEPQDGRSHVRSQMLWDFYSLLNHDLAGHGAPSPADLAFVKGRTYDDVGEAELAALDRLAALLASDPAPRALIDFYRATPALHLPGAERDRYSFVHVP